MHSQLVGTVGKVLLVEDEEIAKLIATSWFSDRGLHVDHAETYAEIKALLAHHHYRMIIMDIGLPADTLSGLEITEKLTADAATSHIPIVGVTGLVNPEIHAKALDAGMLACYSKPLTKPIADRICERYLLRVE